MLDRKTAAELRRLRAALTDLLAWAEAQRCDHETLERGGAIWTLCADCGRKWADDEGGFQPDAEPAAITAAYAALAR